VLSVYQDDKSMPTVAVWLDKEVSRMWIAFRSVAPNTDKYVVSDDIIKKTETVVPSTLMKVLLEQSCNKSYLDNFYSTDSSSSANTSSKCVEYKGHFLTVVDYIPLKQWTHITIGVDGPIVNVYKDGFPVRSSRVRTLVQSPDGNVIKVGKYMPDSSLFTGRVKSVVVFNSATPNSKDAKHGFTSPPFTDRYADNKSTSVKGQSASKGCKDHDAKIKKGLIATSVIAGVLLLLFIILVSVVAYSVYWINTNTRSSE
jgi:hypothetical protein